MIRSQNQCLCLYVYAPVFPHKSLKWADPEALLRFAPDCRQNNRYTPVAHFAAFRIGATFDEIRLRHDSAAGTLSHALRFEMMSPQRSYGYRFI